MRKVYLPLSIFSAIASCLLLSSVKAGGSPAVFSPASVTRTISSAGFDLMFSKAETVAEELYDNMDLGELGLNKQALLYAVKGYQKLVQRGSISNPYIITVCDFSQRSDKKRMYVLDLKSLKVLVNTYVAHGRNSGLQYAERFSNRSESLQSSLGFYVTKQTYFGKHGLSLRLGGLDNGYNDNAEARAVVVHGADYIGDHRVGAAYMGRSFGCPAVPSEVSSRVINLIKNGTCLFIYHPSQSYLHGSRILNG